MRRPDQGLERIRALARLMDSRWVIPGTGIHVGLDSLIGLIPGVGDVLTTIVSGYIVLEAARVGIPGTLLFRLLFNLGIDSLIGSIPVLGDIFDIGWRANARNVALVEEHFHSPERSRRGNRRFAMFVILAFVLIMMILSLAIAAVILALRTACG